MDRFIKEVKDLLGNRLKKIILYGSYARGDYNSSSDVDIMILTDCNDTELEHYMNKIADIAYDIECDNNFDITLSPIIKNIDKYNKRISFIPFYRNVETEGVILHNG